MGKTYLMMTLLARQTFGILSVAITLNLFIALAMIVWLFGTDGLEIISDFTLNLTIGIAGLFMTAAIIARPVADWIHRRPRHAIFAGIVAFAILAVGTLMGSTVGFLSMGLRDTASLSDKLYDYYFKPFYWISLFGCVPTAMTGALTGFALRRSLGAFTTDENG